MKKYALVVLTALLFTPQVFANWSLQSEQSDIKFISVKNNAIAEISEFKTLQGSIDKKGTVNIAINLSSVDTNIAVRDQRLQKELFEVSRYPQAMLTGSVDVTKLKALKVGERYTDTVSLSLSLHGVEKNVTAKVAVIKMASGMWGVSSAEPVILNAADYQLTAGVEKLMALAGLSAINVAVPVSFNFIFK